MKVILMSKWAFCFHFYMQYFQNYFELVYLILSKSLRHLLHVTNWTTRTT